MFVRLEGHLYVQMFIYRSVKQLIEDRTSIKTSQQILVNDKGVELEDARTLQQYEVAPCVPACAYAASLCLASAYLIIPTKRMLIGWGHIFGP